MDKEQTQKRETIVKSMKKKFKDFRKRYGKDAKSVMYATATKMAMKESVVKEIDPHNAAAGMKEDDGPHFTKLKDSDTPNFTTVAHPEDVVNQSSSEGNVDPYDTRTKVKRELGKRGMKRQEADGYGPEEFTGAVASIAKEETELSEIAVRYVTRKELKDMAKKASDKVKVHTPKVKELAKKVIARGKITEGSERGGLTKRGNTAVDRETHNKSQAEREKVRGVKTSPDTDARSYGRFHSDKYNEGPKQSASDRAGRKKTITKSSPAPTAASNHRMMDILNHPHYKKIAKKD